MQGFCRYSSNNDMGITVNAASKTIRAKSAVCFHSWFDGGVTSWLSRDTVWQPAIGGPHCIISAVHLAFVGFQFTSIL